VEPEVHIIEKYFQEILHCFTMTNIRCKKGKEIDLLAINPLSGEKYHVESRVGTSPSFKIKLRDTHTKSGRPHKIGIDYFAREKFDHEIVKDKIREIFGDTNYEKWLVVWHVQNDSVMNEADREFQINIQPLGLLLDEMIEKRTTRGSRDDVLRTIEFISLHEEARMQKLPSELDGKLRRIYERAAKFDSFRGISNRRRPSKKAYHQPKGNSLSERAHQPKR
jgi:hypothetical protein